MSTAEPMPADAKPDLSDLVVVRAGHLVDPNTGSSKPNQRIFIRAGRIEAVTGDVAMPDGAREVDLSSSWVLRRKRGSK
jgi:predicted amidohydrolase